MYFINDDKQKNEDMFNKILEIGKIIDESIKIKSVHRDLTSWNNTTKHKPPKILIIELSGINKINNDLLNNLVKDFMKNYGQMECIDYAFQLELYYNWFDDDTDYIRHLDNTPEMTLKIFCHLTYIIKEINDIISTKNHNFNIPIELNSYIIDFNVKNKDKFISKTYALLYSIINKCYTKVIEGSIVLDEKGDPYIKYYTNYITTIAFFELYKQIRTSQLHTIGQGVFKSCNQCGLLFYNKRKNAKCCNSESCKKKRNSQYVKNNYWKNKLS